MQLEKLKTQMLEQGYVHSADYSKITGLNKSKVDDRIQSGRLEYKRVGRYRFIKQDSQPKDYIDRTAWLTVSEYAERNQISKTTVLKMAKTGRIESKTVGERFFVLGDVTLVKEEKVWPCGKTFHYWTQEPKKPAVVFS